MGYKVLLIEDNEQNRYLITYLLAKNDFNVIQAYDGQTGIKIACKEKPDIILLDIQLPILDGYEVAKRLQSKPETCHIPIIAVTSYAMKGDREKVLAAGCTGYIEKPIDPDSFVNEIMSFLKHKG